MARICTGWLRMVVLLAAGGCASHAGRPGMPDPAPDAWRGFVGCYRVDDSRVVLDSVPETLIWDAAAGVRIARFDPAERSIAYWMVDDRGVVWVHGPGGLFGINYEFTNVRGDTLTGRQWLIYDVPGRTSPRRAIAVRTQDCPPPPTAR